MDESDLIVMSFNVRDSNLDHDTTTKWVQRKQIASKMIEIYKPDIIGTQETQIAQLKFFEQNGYKSFGKLSSTAILFDSDKFELIDGNTIWLSETPTIANTKSWDMDQPRTVNWVLLQENQITCDANDQNKDECLDSNNNDNMQRYLVFNTHLDHRGFDSRYQSCLVIKDLIYNISTVQYSDQYPLIITGDFNSAKHSNVHSCFLNNDLDTFDLNDALFETEYVGNYKKYLQYTFHHFHGLQLNTWYMRWFQYLLFGFSSSIVKVLKDQCCDGICCFGASLHDSVLERFQRKEKAGVHHLDWILYGNSDNNEIIESVNYFEVIAYHKVMDSIEPMKFTKSDLFHDRIVRKAIYPSDHFPIIAGFKINKNN